MINEDSVSQWFTVGRNYKPLIKKVSLAVLGNDVSSPLVNDVFLLVENVADKQAFNMAIRVFNETLADFVSPSKKLLYLANWLIMNGYVVDYSTHMADVAVCELYFHLSPGQVKVFKPMDTEAVERWEEVA